MWMCVCVLFCVWMRTFARLQFDRFCIKATDNMFRWYFTHDLFAWSIKWRKSSSSYLLSPISLTFLLHLSKIEDKKTKWYLNWFDLPLIRFHRHETAQHRKNAWLCQTVIKSKKNAKHLDEWLWNMLRFINAPQTQTTHTKTLMGAVEVSFVVYS